MILEEAVVRLQNARNVEPSWRAVPVVRSSVIQHSPPKRLLAAISALQLGQLGGEALGGRHVVARLRLEVGILHGAKPADRLRSGTLRLAELGELGVPRVPRAPERADEPEQRWPDDRPPLSN